MDKKHLITCSVIVVIAIISTLNICSVLGSNSSKSRFGGKKAISINTNTDLSFADEALPVNDAGVNLKLQHSLQKHGFQTIQSDILQTKAIQLFPVIEPILKAYGIPDDFKYMPLVESGLNSGTSPKGAKGVWQFMPKTARILGLKVGKRHDERLNLQKSTVAACRYLKDLHVEFNSWTLAAAAYNEGDAKLNKAIYAQNEDNYFRMHLNHETATYVYNLLAMKQIISQPEKYGYKTYF